MTTSSSASTEKATVADCWRDVIVTGGDERFLDSDVVDIGLSDHRLVKLSPEIIPPSPVYDGWWSKSSSNALLSDLQCSAFASRYRFLGTSSTRSNTSLLITPYRLNSAVVASTHGIRKGLAKISRTEEGSRDLNNNASSRSSWLDIQRHMRETFNRARLNYRTDSVERKSQNPC